MYLPKSRSIHRSVAPVSIDNLILKAPTDLLPIPMRRADLHVARRKSMRKSETLLSSSKASRDVKKKFLKIPSENNDRGGRGGSPARTDVGDKGVRVGASGRRARGGGSGRTGGGSGARERRTGRYIRKAIITARANLY